MLLVWLAFMIMMIDWHEENNDTIDGCLLVLMYQISLATLALRRVASWAGTGTLGNRGLCAAEEEAGPGGGLEYTCTIRLAYRPSPFSLTTR